MFKKILFLGLILSLVIIVIGCTPTPPTPKADLIILSLDPPDVNCGLVGPTVLCTNSATFTIANVGAADAGPFKVLIQGDPGLAQTKVIPVTGLAAGSTKTFTAVALPAGGNCYDPDCTMCITVDSLNEIIESDEGNNNYCETTIG